MLMRSGHKDDQPVRQVVFQGNALADMRDMPVSVRTAFGHSLWELQNGITPDNASPFELSQASEVMKLTERFDGDTYRCVYAAKFERAVYVLHVFQKKSKSGIATPKKDIDLVYSRLERAKQEYAVMFGAEAKNKKDRQS